MTNEIWFTPAVVALLIWGVTAIMPKIALRKLSQYQMSVYHSFFFLIVAVFVQFFYGGPEYQMPAVLFAMVTGACGTLGQLLYLTALKDGPVTYVSMISSLYPLVATLLAAIILHDPVTLRQGLGVVLGLCSIILLVKADGRG
jgi:bacterial/archaeal transporter family protein